MNEFGQMAHRHWEQFRPMELAQIPDPQTHFSQLGEQIAQRVDDLMIAHAGDDPREESFLQKTGRLQMARVTAQEQALREMLPPPEPGHPEAEPEDETIPPA